MGNHTIDMFSGLQALLAAGMVVGFGASFVCAFAQLPIACELEGSARADTQKQWLAYLGAALMIALTCLFFYNSIK